jgi:NAD(P)-dependent dehydrogenase (short-subunit alcohol dehydrogenase family)
MRLKGKTAIITGAARGIGRASVQLFVAEGAQVVMFDIDDAGMKETVNLVGSSDCTALHTDITSETEVSRNVAKVVEKFGKIDILFHNAAYNKNFKAALDTSEQDWDVELNVTLKGGFFCSKHVIPHMIKQGGGSIVMTGSWLALAAYPGYAAYCAAKGGLVQLARSLAVDYSPKNVRVNVICPGPVDTPALAPIKNDPVFYGKVKQMTLLGRIAQPEEIARAALFFASDESSYITGAILTVDGGALALLA